MITIDKDTKTPTWVITKTDSEGYHRQLTLTEGEVRELAAILLDAEAEGKDSKIPEEIDPNFTKSSEDAYLQGCIDRASAHWKGVDVDKYMEMVRYGECPKSDACGDLEDEVMRYWNDHALEYRLGRVSDLDFLHLCARHFAEWGAEHLKK